MRPQRLLADIYKKFRSLDLRSQGRVEQKVKSKFMAKLARWGRKLTEQSLNAAKFLWEAMTDPEVPWKYRAIAIAVLAYFINPIDLIPDILPGGFSDDAAALTTAFYYITAALVRHSEKRKG